MAPVTPTAEQLQTSNIRVEKRPGVTQRIVPVDKLKNSIKLLLPPPGPYFDQSTLDAASEAFDENKKCVFCWNTKNSDQTCKSEKKCVACKSKNHRGRDCPRLYAGINWWEARGHRLRKKAQLRPNPGERAYLIVAGVFKDWKKLDDPVVVNMKHPIVKAFYKDKKTPSVITSLPKKLRSSPVTTAAKPHTISLIFGPDAGKTTPTIKCGTDVDSASNATSVQPRYAVDVTENPEVGADASDIVSNSIDQTQSGSLSAEVDDTFLDNLLEDTWQLPSYHEGIQRATITPLSIRLAITAAQRFNITQQPISAAGNEVRPDLDPRLQTRTRPESITDISRPLTTKEVFPIDVQHKDEIWKMKAKHRRCLKELEDARKEIKAQDRRIQELELALHEAEGWTDAVTYHAGQKRSMF